MRVVFDDFRDDYFRYTGTRRVSLLDVLRDHSLRFLLCLRGGVLLRPLRRHLGVKYGLSLGNGGNIGPGLYLGHAYGINVNPGARLGRNCSLHKGCTVGQENRGPRRGCPTIGENVWIGINATVVGAIEVGDDVLIAPGAYVNRDVPNHSVVMGNPCTIHARAHATDGYNDNLLP